MSPEHEKNYEAWFRKAQEDGLSATAILKDKDGSPNTVCFLAQQMAEKYLKGLVIFHEKEFQKVHDLLRIESLLLEAEPEIQNIHEDCKQLNRYYIETRYPGDYPEFHWDDAEEALGAAQRIKTFILEKIRMEESERF